MRIAIIIPGFMGGAPKSILQYASVLKSNGHSVLVCGKQGASDCKSAFSNLGVEVCEFSCGVTDKDKFQKIKGIVDALHCARKWGPDLIITVGVHLSAYISNIIESKGIRSLCLIPGGNLESGKNLIKTIRSEHAIVFSQENKTQLEKYGFKGTVRVISNRIPALDLKDCDDWYTEKNGKRQHLFIASRVTKDKKKSIKTVIDFFDWFAASNKSATLTVAGVGECLDEIMEYAKAKPSSDKIKFLGWISNVEDYYKEADVCFGKGRSIIEPLIMGRYAVCISEDDKMKWVTSTSFSNLEHYNFSGRNIDNPENYDQIKKYIDNRCSNKSLVDLEEVKAIAASNYGASYLEEKFYNDFFSVCFKNLKSDNRWKPCKLGLYISVVKYWLKTRKV